jgi:hypothetical protein
MLRKPMLRRGLQGIKILMLVKAFQMRPSVLTKDVLLHGNDRIRIVTKLYKAVYHTYRVLRDRFEHPKFVLKQFEKISESPGRSVATLSILFEMLIGLQIVLDHFSRWIPANIPKALPPVNDA